MEKFGKLPLSKNENGPFRVNYWSAKMAQFKRENQLGHFGILSISICVSYLCHKYFGSFLQPPCMYSSKNGYLEVILSYQIFVVYPAFKGFYSICHIFFLFPLYFGSDSRSFQSFFLWNPFQLFLILF